MSAVSLRLPDDVSRRLQELADRTGRSKTFYMIEAIQEHLDDLEDLYLAEQRLIDLRTGKSETVPLGDLMKRYGVDGRA
ncbi:MAG: TraY domain-containing protein [Acidobacteria bacterium]|nr:TraY domain-containing protein [Acidobacteriota bacterium]MYK89028.1 TraY domain-containing protein [Acidobacteriota bacterium]